MTMFMKRSREYADVEAQAMANCLMLMSHVGRNNSSSSSPCSFECKTCGKKFPSFQALGGHRASHKKPKLISPAAGEQEGSPEKSKMHRCSVCGVEFAMGQALGGHMRRHRAAVMKAAGFEKPAVAAVPAVLKRMNSSKRVFGFGLNLDLNLIPDDENDDTAPKTPVLRCFI